MSNYQCGHVEPWQVDSWKCFLYLLLPHDQNLLINVLPIFSVFKENLEIVDQVPRGCTLRLFNSKREFRLKFGVQEFLAPNVSQVLR
jgi:hypothetical protein